FAQYWSAPDRFLGNRSAAYGGSLSFDLADTAKGGLFAQEDVILIGGGETLVYALPGYPGPDWASFTVSLVEAGCHLTSLSGPNATAAELQSVLASLAALYIRAEYRLGSDFQSLDNVVLSTPFRNTEIAVANLTAGQGSIVTFFATLTTGGSPLTNLPVFFSL